MAQEFDEELQKILDAQPQAIAKRLNEALAPLLQKIEQENERRNQLIKELVDDFLMSIDARTFLEIIDKRLFNSHGEIKRVHTAVKQSSVGVDRCYYFHGCVLEEIITSFFSQAIGFFIGFVGNTEGYLGYFGVGYVDRGIGLGIKLESGDYVGDEPLPFNFEGAFIEVYGQIADPANKNNWLSLPNHHVSPPESLDIRKLNPIEEHSADFQSASLQAQAVQIVKHGLPYLIEYLIKTGTLKP